MTLSIPATFDWDNILAMAFLKGLPAEQRGVFHSLMDALKAARDVMFRVGGLAPDDAQVAQMACEHVDVLQRVLPELEFTRFILRGEDGVLYSPHLVERTSDPPLGTRSDPRSRAPRTHDMPGC
ncbi:hypothetical protein [Gluconobacter cerinus]|uniref:Uncharacterized protein n=1 Tax=Gluconobacter cerinus TaxID=38307 RepID=A0AAV5NF26_9PROT|nr:hypothetical protein [Gluconobacter cerinus]GBR05957.1 hypothetical protein AA0229_2419 [Gluconobacter cerinus NRIC 0229]GLQ62537.1 hypothetical protein GCM10007867_13820 [Gluconobacter cerinus]